MKIKQKNKKWKGLFLVIGLIMLISLVNAKDVYYRRDDLCHESCSYYPSDDVKNECVAVSNNYDSQYVDCSVRCYDRYRRRLDSCDPKVELDIYIAKGCGCFLARDPYNPLGPSGTYPHVKWCHESSIPFVRDYDYPGVERYGNSMDCCAPARKIDKLTGEVLEISDKNIICEISDKEGKCCNDFADNKCYMTGFGDNLKPGCCGTDDEDKHVRVCSGSSNAPDPKKQICCGDDEGEEGLCYQDEKGNPVCRSCPEGYVEVVNELCPVKKDENGNPIITGSVVSGMGVGGTDAIRDLCILGGTCVLESELIWIGEIKVRNEIYGVSTWGTPVVAEGKFSLGIFLQEINGEIQSFPISTLHSVIGDVAKGARAEPHIGKAIDIASIEMEKLLKETIGIEVEIKNLIPREQWKYEIDEPEPQIPKIETDGDSVYIIASKNWLETKFFGGEFEIECYEKKRLGRWKTLTLELSSPINDLSCWKFKLSKEDDNEDKRNMAICLDKNKKITRYIPPNSWPSKLFLKRSQNSFDMSKTPFTIDAEIFYNKDRNQGELNLEIQSIDILEGHHPVQLSGENAKKIINYLVANAFLECETDKDCIEKQLNPQVKVGCDTKDKKCRNKCNRYEPKCGLKGDSDCPNGYSCHSDGFCYKTLETINIVPSVEQSISDKGRSLIKNICPECEQYFEPAKPKEILDLIYSS